MNRCTARTCSLAVLFPATSTVVNSGTLSRTAVCIKRVTRVPTRMSRLSRWRTSDDKYAVAELVRTLWEMVDCSQLTPMGRPSFISSMSGNSSGNSCVVAITLASSGDGRPGRLVSTGPLPCQMGSYCPLVLCRSAGSVICSLCKRLSQPLV